MSDTRTRIPADCTAPDDLLAGRVILVTGAGSGIGRAVARRLAAHGATVVLLGRTVRKLEATYDSIVASGGPEPAIYPLDLATAGPEAHEALATTVVEQLGRLDGIIHNAARLGSLAPLEHLPPRQWAEVLQVNLSEPFLMTRACLPALRRSPEAVIVFTSDAVGRTGRAYWGAYGVAKFGLEGLAQILADEVENEPGLRVTCVNPGPVRTGLRANAYPTEDQTRLPEPEAIAGAYLYLLGPEGRALAGASVDIESGS